MPQLSAKGFFCFGWLHGALLLHAGFLVAERQGGRGYPLLVAACGLHAVVAPLIVEHRL